MKNFFKIGLLSSAVLFLSACDQFDLDNKKNKFYYSNPSEKMISFSVDDKEYQVEPGKNGYIMLSPGGHNLKDSAGNSASFMVYENNNGGILNPDNFMYYTLSEVYAAKGKTDQFKTVDYPLIINGYEFELPVRSTNATFIDGNAFQCTYTLGEPFPTEIRTRNKNNDGGIKNKCFDKPEFIKYISTEYSKDLNPFTQEDEYNDSVNLDLNYRLPTAEFTDPDIQAEAEELVSLLNQIKESDDPKIHNTLKDKLYKATLAVSNAYANRAVKDSVEDNKYYTHFIEASGQFQSYGILPKD
ncbi:hypothetical protein [Proteus sp. FME41]|uniref:hypothetical protein n=1 Tax=Proteus sp. FME41 TaxID=2742608 RepID=UPI00186887CF|nr:hypothetical protein [Proteus sp. FME41]